MDILSRSGWIGQSSTLSRRPACRCFQCRGDRLTTSNPALPNLPPVTQAVVPQTGVLAIDALLSGYRWGISEVTYSFYSRFFGGNYYGSETGVSEVTTAIKNNIRLILRDYIQPLINLRFREISDSSRNYGLIRIQFSNQPGYAYAYYPDSTDFNQRNFNDVSGDVHLSPDYGDDPANTFEGAPGSYGFETLTHELLHTLGLKHPGNYFFGGGVPQPPYLPFSLDNTTNTVMSYNYNDVAVGGVGLMPYDILALQYLYGASNLNSGNTTYRFTSIHSYFDGIRNWGTAAALSRVTIWDAGGNDTLDFSALAFDAGGYRLDLNAGGISTQRVAFQAATYTADNDISATPYPLTTHGTLLAFRPLGDSTSDPTLENAIGSSSNDSILGNGANNFLDGSQGNDDLSGAEGDDVLYGREGRDFLSGNLGQDFLSGGPGADTLSGGQGADQLAGGNGNDLLLGGNGNDLLDGGLGDNQFIGGDGADQFVLRVGEGFSTIFDFQDGVDLFRLGDGLQVSGLTFTQIGSNAWILLGNDLLFNILNLNVAQISAADFVA